MWIGFDAFFALRVFWATTGKMRKAKMEISESVFFIVHLLRYFDFRNRLLTRAVLYRDREGAADHSSRKRCIPARQPPDRERGQRPKSVKNPGSESRMRCQRVAWKYGLIRSYRRREARELIELFEYD